MKYMLLIHSNETAIADLSPDDTKALMQRHQEFGASLAASGQMLDGHRLRPEAEARRVRVRGGQRSVVDGPFAETKEVLGGFYLIEAVSMDEAIAIAARCPSAAHGTIEVRPIWTA